MTTSHDFPTVNHSEHPESCSYEACDGSLCIKNSKQTTAFNVCAASHTTSDFTAYYCSNRDKSKWKSMQNYSTLLLLWFEIPLFYQCSFLMCWKDNVTFIHYRFVGTVTLFLSAQWKCFIFKIPLEAVGGGNCPQVCMHIKR